MVLNFLLQHKDDDVRSLAFAKMPEGVNRTWALRQIEGYQLAKKKLPRWATLFEQGADICFPPRLSMEQCSSEATAKYKARIVQTSNLKPQISNLIDFTGGFGVDFSYMAQGFEHAMYVEQNPELCEIAKHNFEVFGLDNVEIVNASCEETLAKLSTDSKKRVIYLDPARRDSVGNKVFSIEDCTPNLAAIQDSLISKADLVIVKLSPMLDITQALRTLHHVSEVHVVSVRGECKELVFVIGEDTSPKIFCVNLGADEDEFVGSVTNYQSPITSSLNKSSFSNLKPQIFLFEPNASIMKAGVQDAFGIKYGLQKLHPNSNLFVGTKPIDRIPARQFRIVGVSDFSKASLKLLLKDIDKANLAIRNFPSDVATLRKRLKIKEGGNDYLFATTLFDDTHALIRCVKV